MNERLQLGEVLKPQGVRGEIKVKPYVDDVNRFKTLKEVYLEDKFYKVLSVRIFDGFVYLGLSGVGDRNEAETLRGKRLFVDRDNAVKLPKGRYFIADLLGASVILDDGTFSGTVTDIQNGVTDIYTIEKDGKIIRFPFLKDAVISVDVENKKITLKAKRFNEISVEE